MGRWPGPFVLLVGLAVSSEGAVQRLSPNSGSFCGGTRISIFGSGFAKDPSANRVDIGDGECRVESVSEDKLVCRVPFRDAKVVTGKEKVVEIVSVHADGEPLMMGKPLEFTFKAEGSPSISDWGPAVGQANDVLSFQGKEPLFGASVSLGGRECKAKYSEGSYYQCVPPAREAGLSNVEVDYGPDRGYACPGEKAQPLQFTYNLALQSAEPADSTGGPPDTLTIVGQGLGQSTVFRLCGGDALCIREGDVTAEPALYHGGDWSFQTVTCRPSPLDPSKASQAPGSSRKCSLTAEGANGMFIATLADAWTYVVPAAPVPAEIATTTAQLAKAQPTLPTASTAVPDSTPAPLYVASSPPAAAPAITPPAAVAAPAAATSASSPMVAPSPAAPGSAPGPAPAPAFLTPVSSPMAFPPFVSKQQLEKHTIKKMATKVLSKVFQSIAEALSGKRETQSLTETAGAREQAAPQLPPAHPATKIEPYDQDAPVPVLEPPAPPPPGLMVEAAPPAPAVSAWLQTTDAKVVQLHTQHGVLDAKDRARLVDM